MVFAEIIVNVPIRRTFSRRYADVADPDATEAFAGDAGKVPDDDQAYHSLQTFHYHLPPDLEQMVIPGHLVWVPFGAQEVQGFVLNVTDTAPVQTKAVLRLARPEPVLMRWQLALATWIARYYVAPLSESIKLFLPPGLLEKKGRGRGVRAKRELQVELIADPRMFDERLERIARTTPRSCVLGYLLANTGRQFSVSDLNAECGLKKNSQTIKTLERNGLVEVSDGSVSLAQSVEKSREAYLELRGLNKYLPVLHALEEAEVPLWKGELYAQVETNLSVLRDLEQAGLVALSEQVRFRDPLAGRTYPRTQAPKFTSEQILVWQQIQKQGFGCQNDGRKG